MSPVFFQYSHHIHRNYIWEISTDTDEIDQSVALHRLEFSVQVVDVDLKDQVQVQDDKPSEREDEMVKISDVEHLETLPNHMWNRTIIGPTLATD